MPGTTKEDKKNERAAELKRTRQDAGSSLSWTFADGVIELALHREPCNETGIDVAR